MSSNGKFAALAPIAIVGIGCRLPGGINSPAEFWELLLEGKTNVSQIGSDRFP